MESYTVKKSMGLWIISPVLAYLLFTLCSFLFNDIPIIKKLFVILVYMLIFITAIRYEKITFYSLAVIIPFNLVFAIFIPWLANMSFYLAETIICSLIIVWLLRLLRQKELKFKKSNLDILVVMLIGISIISLIPHIPHIWNALLNDPFVSIKIFKEQFLADILFSLNRLHLILLASLIYFYTTNNKINKKIFINLLMLSLVMISIYSIISFGFKTPFIDRIDGGVEDSYINIQANKRVEFPFGNPNVLAGFSLLIIGLPIIMFIRNKRQNWLLLPIILFLANLVLTGSRGAFIGLDVAFCTYIFLIAFKNKFNFKKLPYKKIALVFFLLMIFSFTVLVHRHYNFETSEMQDIDKIKNTYEQRTDSIWLGSINMFENNIIIGEGIGLFSVNIDENIPQDVKDKYPEHYSSAHAHNLFLHTLAETGILSLVVYMLIIFCIGKAIYEKNKNYTLAFSLCVLAVIGHGIFDHPLYWREIFILFWIEMGMIFS